MDPETSAALIETGGALFGGLLNRNSGSRYRKPYQYEIKYGPLVQDSRIGGAIAAAEKHGVHPLVALGTDPSVNGGFGPGSSTIGDAVAASGRALADARKQKYTPLEAERIQAEIDLLKAQAKSVGKEGPTTPGPTGPIPAGPATGIPTINPATQELKKGDVQTHKPGQPTSSTREMSPMTGIRIGSQTPEFPVEEADSIVEDPVKAFAAAMAYHGNKHIDWWWAVKDYWFGPGLPAEMVTEGTNRMLERIRKEAAKKTRGTREKQREVARSKTGSKPKPRPLSRR